MGASAPYRPINRRRLSVKLVRKADSFTSEGALFRWDEKAGLRGMH
jgi:hypothetical protein